MAAKKPDAKKASRSTAPKSPPKVKAREQEVSFHCAAPDATSVALAGDFNRWDPTSTPMFQDLDGTWRVTLRLPAGTYEYKFVLNGHMWVEDPMNSRKVPNAQGSMNSICEVP